MNDELFFTSAFSVPRSSFLYNIRLEREKNFEEVVPFCLAHFEFVERLCEQFDGDVPVLFRDSKTCVHGLHAASNVVAWSACGCAQLIKDKLAYALL